MKSILPVLVDKNLFSKISVTYFCYQIFSDFKSNQPI